MQNTRKDPSNIDSFIERWSDSAGAERANYQSFLSELCDLLGVPRPDPSKGEDLKDTYVFDKKVLQDDGLGHKTPNWIDLYKKGCFVCETKQGSNPDAQEDLFFADLAARRKGHGVRLTPAWKRAMLKAKNQALDYARCLPEEDGWPPFILVVDVGFMIELWADFSGTGKSYNAYPSPDAYQIFLSDLQDKEVREQLRKVWTSPESLDLTRNAQETTRGIAERLGKLSASLERTHAPHSVAEFLMRCVFTMFAEDVQLLKPNTFTDLLREHRGHLDGLAPTLKQLWKDMDRGEYSVTLKHHLKQFNGKIYKNADAIPLTRDQLELLIEAAERDWREVEPSIFGTLLERALDNNTRHKMGAHYTPRVYVERLVAATIMEPLRKQWAAAQATAAALSGRGKTAAAKKEVTDFHKSLCENVVLDPACGSGNFLYVALEMMKRLEGEVIAEMYAIDDKAARELTRQQTLTPRNFQGLELNERAAIVAEMVLWIGYIQWHLRTHKDTDLPEPILQQFENIRYQDALFIHDGSDLARDGRGRPVQEWDRVSYVPNPNTGELMPNPDAKRELEVFKHPRVAPWPDADFIVGNPPFLGGKDLRAEWGDGYADTLRDTYDELPASADLVMYWWHRAATAVRTGKAERFGFITTNSIRQVLARQVTEQHFGGKPPLSLHMAIPDHPWINSADGAAVRISMTVGGKGEFAGKLLSVSDERRSKEDHIDVSFETSLGRINPDLTIGPDLTTTKSLDANAQLSCPGVKLHGKGFIVSHADAETLGLGRIKGLERHIRHYRNGKDLTSKPRGVMVIDLFGLKSDDVRRQYPDVYQWVLERVKPERDQNRRVSYRKNWWIHGEPRRNFRPALDGLKRYIATVETSKHRFFQFLDIDILPDNMLVNIAVEDAFYLGVLSSKVHVGWALASGGRLGVGNDPRYNKTRCFDPFPFPLLSEGEREGIRALGEELDAHRKARQAAHPDLTMTGMYNVLEAMRGGRALTDKEKTINDKGLVTVLKDIHDRLDSAVVAAYGWPADIPEEEMLERLVTLNRERFLAESRGEIHWLRPDYQMSKRRASQDQDMPEAIAAADAANMFKWPTGLPKRVRVIRNIMTQEATAVDIVSICRRLKGAKDEEVLEIVKVLADVGQVREVGEDRFIAVV